MSKPDKTTDKKTAEPEGARGFAHLLYQLNEGAFHSEVSEVLQKLNSELLDQAVSAGGKAKGEITITLKLDVEDSGIVRVHPDVKVKSPKPKRRSQVMWLNKGNNLVPENPKQQSLPGLREVPNNTTQARDVSDEAAPARSV